MKRLVCTAAVALTLAACGGEGKVILHMQPVDTADVHVVPTEVMFSGKKLWVKLIVTNNSKGTIIIQRDQMTAHLPSGQTLTRAMGTYGGGWGYAYGAGYATHEPYVMPPGSMHPVYVEFEEQGFKWKDIASAQVDFAGSITRDGQPVIVPPFVVSR